MTTTPQVRLGALYRNSGARSSGKTGKKSLVLAAELARTIGMVPTWPNLQTIRLAIESEAAYSCISLENAVALMTMAAEEFTIVDVERYSFQAAALLRKANVVNRFWFEDALWRSKETYQNMLARLQQQESA